MAEYIPFPPIKCAECGDHIIERHEAMKITPKIALLTLILILHHDIARDKNSQGFWISYDMDDEEECVYCNEELAGDCVIETSCLHRWHYDCLMHYIIVHRGKFCTDLNCKMRIF